MDKFTLYSTCRPTGDQPKAIVQLTDGLNKGYREQSLLGVTDSGKTFTMANVIAEVNRPTLILATTKHLPHSFAASLKNFSPRTLWSISTVIMISAKKCPKSHI